jgi:hypothetical protein
MTAITKDKITLADKTANPTAVGELLRNGNNLFYHDGTTATQLDNEVLSTKGDILGYDTAKKRIPVGTNDQVLTADSTNANGLLWKTASGGGKLELLGTYREASASGTTQKFEGSWDLDAVYSELRVIITGVTNASMNLLLKLNDHASGYRTYSLNQETTTLTGGSATGQSSFAIQEGNAGGDSYPFTVELTIRYTGTGDTFMVMSRCYAIVNQQYFMVGDVSPTSSSGVITDVEILTTVQAWKIGTQIDLYGVKI